MNAFSILRLHFCERNEANKIIRHTHTYVRTLNWRQMRLEHVRNSIENARKCSRGTTRAARGARYLDFILLLKSDYFLLCI